VQRPFYAKGRFLMCMLSAMGALLLTYLSATTCLAASSANIPLDSPVYLYLEKLAGFGLITSDVKGLKPFSKAEAARLVLEADLNLESGATGAPDFARELIDRTRELLPREVSLQKDPARRPPFIDYNPMASLRMRYVYLDGVPRDYVRLVHDPGNDGVFGIGSGLRSATPNTVVTQVGSEGTPLSENNNGVVYHQGNNGELRWGAEGYVSDKAAALIEPMLLASETGATVQLNRGYLKIGGGALELELGKDENWLGFGYRNEITLTNNAENLTEVKLSSPEPFRAGWLSWLGDLKYALIFSRLDKTFSGTGQEYQPWFYAIKLSSKPIQNLEIGANLGRLQGGPGVSNSLTEWVHGIVGGSNSDNSKANAGFEARYRIPWLRNTELYGEFSGCDAATFWPIVESYVAGFFIPRLTDEGRDDFRFEFFQGNQILYEGDFPAGYTYHGLPLGDSQGGATQDFFTRYSHWFSTRNNLALEFIYTNRGMVGRVPGQAIERVYAERTFWTLPVRGDVDAQIEYGIEKIRNFNLVDGADRTNQLFKLELRYRY
jgi:hypothetical protein